MNVCIFYYDDFCEFEVVHVAAEFSSQDLVTVAMENKVYVSEEKQRFLPDKMINELNPNDIDLFIIPGGNPSYLYDNSKLKDFIKSIDENNKIIAGICGGTELMAAYGLLDYKKCTGDSDGLKSDADYIQFFKNSTILNEDIVVDGNIITSTGQAFIEFAFKLADIMNIYKDEDAIQKSYNWYKNIKV